MIIENGTIEFKRKTPVAIDPETGYPTKPSEVGWSDAIPCQYLPVRHNLLAKENGEPISKATYTVLIEEQPLPEAEQIRLTDRAGKSLGEFSLIAPPEALEAVAEIKITI